ncbi:M23 family metallopeptidase [Leucobacter komagatae]|nr:M23 family metallopeptidase [Leucobacter komagatae]
MSLPPQQPASYPSRRSLREARQRREKASAAESNEALQPAKSPAPAVEGTETPVPEATATPAAEAAEPTPAAAPTLAPDQPVTPPATPGLFLTPLPEFVLGGTQEAAATPSPTTPETAKPKRPTAKKLLAATFSLACVGSLAVTTTLPAFTSAFGDVAAAAAPAARSDQELQSSAVTNSQDALDAIGSVELGVDPGSYKQLTPEAGLVDPASLDSTEIRFAFDREYPLTDGFAYRTAPVEQFHDAQDIAAPGGTPVLAIGSGQVIEAGYATDGCGFSIKLQHNVSGETLTSRYCHMQVDSHDHKVGDKIEIGDFIGKVGNTGMSFGDHLHLALRRSGVPIDPLPYIQEQIDKAAKRAAAKRG